MAAVHGPSKFEYHLTDGADRCSACTYFTQSGTCRFFACLNAMFPRTFKMKTHVSPKGWCFAFTRKGDGVPKRGK